MRNRETEDQKADSDDSSADAAAAAPPTASGRAPAAADESTAVLIAERDEARDRMLRIAADCDNRMKRARKEEAHAVQEARAEVLRDMLEVVDGLERALDTPAPLGEAADGTAVRKGVELILRSLVQKLRRQGVEPIAAAGQPFDPHVHEAIVRVDSVDVPPGTVAAELQRGYRFGDRLLRPAGVAVSTGRASEHATRAAEHATD